ncbi:hypothetical protein JCM33374_g1903 [Metschnikowia sp. JCM 33374]|nr:hypothetical protein JCM33374_g1903 [Metschnikowia sp. JCM 33374]
MLAQKASTGESTETTGETPAVDSDPRGSHLPLKEDTRYRERRLAPRSSNQFRIGPPFSATTTGFLLLNSSKSPVVPRISARLDRGFDMIEGEWIGYKRNYFTLVAAFSFVGLPLNVTATESFEYVDASGNHRPLTAFKISLTSVCLEDNSTAVTLVQHTAKRDRGPQSAPPLYYTVPGELPAHNTMKSVANIRNGDKIDKCNRLFYLSKEDHKRAIDEAPACILATYPQDCDISLVARYERIQFSSAGCGNRKSASTNNKHYILVVELLGVTESGSNVLLASTQSPPLIVRGRSPSNYPISEKKETKNEKKAPKPEPTSLGTNVANLITYSTLDQENNIGGSASSKKKKAKPVPKPLRAPLTPNQNFLNSYTAALLDPELLDSQQKTNGAFSVHYGDPQLQEHPTFGFPIQEPTRGHPFQCLSPVDPNMGLIIAQDTSFPFLVESPSLSGSFSFSSDGEPMNINHSAFQSSQERLHNAMRDYETKMHELEEFIETDLINNFDCYSSLPVPIAFPDTLRTSTPLQLQVMERPVAMRPNLLRNLHPTVARCKHGFKQRKQTKRELRQAERKYTMADLDNGDTSDTSFLMFKNKLASFRMHIRDHSLSSLRSSPLTMLSSDDEGHYLHGIHESGSRYGHDK